MKLEEIFNIFQDSGFVYDKSSGIYCLESKCYSIQEDHTKPDSYCVKDIDSGNSISNKKELKRILDKALDTYLYAGLNMDLDEDYHDFEGLY